MSKITETYINFPFFQTKIKQILLKPDVWDDLDESGNPKFTFDGWVIYSIPKLPPNEQSNIVVSRDIKWKNRDSQFGVMYNLEQKVKNTLWRQFGDLRNLSLKLQQAKSKEIETTRNRKDTVKSALWYLVRKLDMWVKAKRDA